ncbi:MAG: ABC transporter permease subunit, partial [Lachnospiraceae bacterium]|nr:ABC transporter permease subunit [Lachnospiraceae bacterium]
MANKAKQSAKAAGIEMNKTKVKPGHVAAYIVLILISIVWLLPFVGIVLQSFRSFTLEYGGMVDYLLPKTFSLDSYTWLFSGDSQFVKWYANTVTIAFFVAIGQTCMVLMVSYALSRMRFRGRTLWMRVCLILGMFPGFLTMICLYFLLKQFGLTQAGAIPGLILVGVASSGMGYYVCKGFFDTIPKSLDEAARIDGASRARIFFTMIIPLSKPMIIYTALTAFMAPWNDYIFASYIAFGYSDSYNVAVALYRWVNTNDYQ